MEMSAMRRVEGAAEQADAAAVAAREEAGQGKLSSRGGRGCLPGARLTGRLPCRDVGGLAQGRT
jgi:hypothetical protein